MKFFGKILNNLGNNPDREVLFEVTETETVPFTGGYLLTRIKDALQGLKEKGVLPGQRVALIAPNSVDYVAIDLAILASGAVSVPLYHRQNIDEQAAIIENARPALIICHDEQSGSLLSGRVPDSPAFCSLRDIFEGSGAEAKIANRRPDSPAMIIYTSGTSGTAKGVILSAANIDFMFPPLDEMVDRFYKRYGVPFPNERVFHYLPLCFLPSRLSLLTSLYRGSSIYLCLDPSYLKKALPRVNPHCYLTVPLILDRIRTGVEEKIAQKPAFISWLFRQGMQAYSRKVKNCSTVKDSFIYFCARIIVFNKIKNLVGKDTRMILSGSAPLSEETQMWFWAIGISVCQAYGMTETSGVSLADNPEQNILPGHVGFPIDGTRAKISDEGELLLKGPNNFQGYWEMPDETDRVLQNGWLHTGDHVESVDGNYRIVGRIKNLLVLSSGHNVPPEPIENDIRELCPTAQDIVLVGDGRPHLSLVVTGEIAEEQLESAIDEHNKNKPHFMQIRAWHVSSGVFSPENGLLTANMKMKRKNIEHYFRNEIEEMYQKSTLHA